MKRILILTVVSAIVLAFAGIALANDATEVNGISCQTIQDSPKYTQSFGPMSVAIEESRTKLTCTKGDVVLIRTFLVSYKTRTQNNGITRLECDGREIEPTHLVVIKPDVTGVQIVDHLGSITIPFYSNEATLNRAFQAGFGMQNINTYFIDSDETPRSYSGCLTR